MSNTIRFERFSKKRYDTYTKKGMDFHIVNKEGNICRIIAFDCGDDKKYCMVEEYITWDGKDSISTYYAKQDNGCTKYRESEGKLFIWSGPFFKDGDLVVMTNPRIMGRSIFLWDGARPVRMEYLHKMYAYSPFDDMRHSQFISHCTCDKLRVGDEFRLATDKDRDDYRRALRHHRLTWADDGRFYYYPHVGDHYWQIYFTEQRAAYRECVLEDESKRPNISYLIMECDINLNEKLRRQRVEWVVSRINNALGLKDE